MIVKFYKGPWHNKKRALPDSSQDFRIVAPVWNPGLAVDAVSPVGLYMRTKHTHPDGSVFFIWDGWK